MAYRRLAEVAGERERCKMKIEVGMKLHVRADLHAGMSVRYGVNEEMEKLADKEVTVSGVFGSCIKIEEDEGKYAWSYNMFSEFVFWIKEILEKHKKWLNGEDGGERANLCDADLSGANLRGANLRGADLRGANLCDAYLSGVDLSYANLRGANLSGAYLSGADLSDANLRGANLCDAYLSGANLRGADLSDANLSGADLSDANLSGADLSDANLSGADLSDANLSGADLRDANLSGADLSDANLSGADLSGAKSDERTAMYHLACPEEGAFVGFKKCHSYEGETVLVKLEIPEDAKRSSATTRKCRCSKAKVISITGILTGKEYDEAFSQHDKKFVYRVGETVVPDSFDEDRWNECSNGIHFFITKQEAIDY